MVMNFRRFFISKKTFFLRFEEFVEGINQNFIDEFEKSPLKILIVRLSNYREISKSFSHLFLYEECKNAGEDIFVDFAFFPPEPIKDIFKKNKIPFLVGRKSFFSPREFDLILISNSHILELLNLPHLFKNSFFPLYNSDRGKDYPLVILGGLNASLSGFLFKSKNQSVVDGIFIGEGEEWVKKIVKFFKEIGKNNKVNLLADISEKIPHFYTPYFPKKVVYQSINRNLKAMGSNFPLLNCEESDTSFLQISYGCPFFCSFCFEGFERKPYREIPFEDLIKEAIEIKEKRGSEEINLFSLNFNTHTNIGKLLVWLNKYFSRVSAKSQRVDILFENDWLIDVELLSGKRSFTFGIEGISENIRKYYNKYFPDSLLVDFIKKLILMGVREIKLFYILCGREGDEDITSFSMFLEELRESISKGKRSARLIFSFGYLVRMRKTPVFYEDEIVGVEYLREIKRKIAGICRKNGFQFREAMDLKEYLIENFLSKNIKGGNELLEKMFKKDIFFHKRYLDEILDIIKKIPEGKNTKEFPFEVKGGVSREFLEEFFKRRENLNCFQGECIGCGVCTREERKSIKNHFIEPIDLNEVKQLEDILTLKRKYKKLLVEVDISEKFYGGNKKWINSNLMSQFFEKYPQYVHVIFEMRENLFTLKENCRKFPFFYGKSVFEVKFLGDLNLSYPVSLRDFKILKELKSHPVGISLKFKIFFEDEREILKAIDSFLKENFLPYTLIKTGSLWEFRFSQKALKKKIIYKMNFRRKDDFYILKFSSSMKVNLSDLINKFEMEEIYNISIRVVDLIYDFRKIF